jgi:hypothetical protein
MKNRHLIASRESSSTKPQAIRVAEVRKLVYDTRDSRVFDVNPDPQPEIIVVSRFVEHVSIIAFHHRLYVF